MSTVQVAAPCFFLDGATYLPIAADTIVSILDRVTYCLACWAQLSQLHPGVVCHCGTTVFPAAPVATPTREAHRPVPQPAPRQDQRPQRPVDPASSNAAPGEPAGAEDAAPSVVSDSGSEVGSLYMRLAAAARRDGAPTQWRAGTANRYAALASECSEDSEESAVREFHGSDRGSDVSPANRTEDRAVRESHGKGRGYGVSPANSTEDRVVRESHGKGCGSDVSQANRTEDRAVRESHGKGCGSDVSQANRTEDRAVLESHGTGGGSEVSQANRTEDSAVRESHGKGCGSDASQAKKDKGDAADFLQSHASSSGNEQNCHKEYVERMKEARDETEP